MIVYYRPIKPVFQLFGLTHRAIDPVNPLSFPYAISRRRKPLILLSKGFDSLLHDRGPALFAPPRSRVSVLRLRRVMVECLHCIIPRLLALGGLMCCFNEMILCSFRSRRR